MFFLKMTRTSSFFKGGTKRLSIFATSVFGSLHYLHFTLNAPILSTEWMVWMLTID